MGAGFFLLRLTAYGDDRRKPAYFFPNTNYIFFSEWIWSQNTFVFTL